MPRNRKTRALVAMLALASPKPLLRVNVARLLWSQREPDQARGSLRQSVREIQETLGKSWNHLFVADRHYLALRGADLHVDALAIAEPKASPEDYDFELPLLEDIGGLDPAFDRWLNGERIRFARIGRSIGESILARCESPQRAIRVAERLLKIDGSHDGAWQAIMRAYLELRDFGAAEDSYERMRGVLAQDPDARPSPAIEALIADVRQQRSLAKANQGPSLGHARPDRSEAFRNASRLHRETGRLRLAVAPFRVIGPDPDDGLPAGLGAEVAAGLSRFRWMSCIPAEMWPPGLQLGAALAAGLDADLVLDTAVQYGARRLHIQVRLLDVLTGGGIVWVRRLDRDPGDPMSIQDEVAAAIVADVEREAMQQEGRRVSAMDPQDLNAQDMMWLALPAIFRMDRTGFDDAQRLLQGSLRADPSNPFALGWMSYWHVFLFGQGWATDREIAAAEAIRLADRAVMLDPADALAMTLAGHARGFLMRQPREAQAFHERALAANPNLAIAWCLSGLSHCYLGDHAEALRRIERAITLSPNDPHAFFFYMALTMPYNLLGDFARASIAGAKAIELNPKFSSSYKGYLVALGLGGRGHDAGRALAKLLEMEPGFSVARAIARSPLTRADDLAVYADGLRLSGLVEWDSATQLTLAIDD